MDNDELRKGFNESRETLELCVAIRDLLKRILLLEEFIRNGVKSGYIIVPDEGDPVLDTIEKIMG